MRTQEFLDDGGKLVEILDALDGGADLLGQLGKKREPVGAVALATLGYEIGPVCSHALGNGLPPRVLRARHRERAPDGIQNPFPAHLWRRFHCSRKVICWGPGKSR